jgi:F-type H+-transporting ATPase subunit b
VSDLRARLRAVPSALLVTSLASQARAAEGGLEIFPQLTLPGLALLFSLMLLFTLLIPLVNVLLCRPIFRVLDRRDERITGTRRRAEQLAAEADVVAGRYESAISASREELESERRERLEAARRDSASEAAGARAAAEREIEAARRELAAALAEARTRLRVEAEGLAREAAARVLGRPL